MKQGLLKFLAFASTAVLALSLLVVGSVAAQIVSGDLVGVVLDKTGAAVPNARIEATNVATGVKLSTVASDSGEYRLNNLPVGTYNVSASADAFGTTTINGLQIQLNNTLTQQITLEIKGAVTSVEVSGVAATLDTTTAQLQTTFAEKEIADLPSVSANASGVLNLSLLSAGVASSGGVGVGSGPSVGGQRPRNNNFTIEGVDNNNKGVTGPLVTIPNDAVAEFSLLENQFSPEFGHSSGGQFNTVVKSGTNSFHGLAYIYNQNRDYDALDTLNALEGLGSGSGCAADPSGCHAPGPRFDQNRIGGQIGGPIIKNKLFFFVNYEYEPEGQAAGGGSVCAPTAASYATINATPGLSATNVAILEQYVQPGTLNVGCDPIAWTNGTTLDTAGLAIAGPSFLNSRFVTSSLDYNISNSDQIRGRYIYNSAVGVDNAATLPIFFTPQPNKFHLVTINEYHTFTPTLTNELRLGFNRFAQAFTSGNFSFPGLDVFPNITLNDLNFLNVGPDGNAPQSAVQNTYQLAEALTWTKGRHTLKFGVEGRKLIAPQTFTQRERGDYEYNNTLEFLQDQIPTSFAERSNGTTVYYGDQSAVYWYANDNFRIRPNVTLNLGVRYEYTTSPYSERLQVLNSAASVPGLINFGEPQWSKNNFAPRIGIAWSPGKEGRTSIRAGFGEAFDTLFDNLGLLSVPPQLGATNDCAPNFGSYPCVQNSFLGSGGILPGPGGLITYDTIADQRANTSAFLPDHQKMPKSIDWTLGIQHAFANDYTVEVRYVGTRGIHLPAQIQLNKTPKVTATNNIPTYFTAPDQGTLDGSANSLGTVESASALVPAYGDAGFVSTITSYQPWASSTYHGLAAQVTKKFSHGLQGVFAYTYSHNIDDATAEVFSTVLAPRRAQNGLDLSADRANSILDHRHRVTLSLIYDEPFFKNSNAFLRNTVGNWEIAPIYTYQSGQWVTSQSAIDSNLNGDAAGDRTVVNPSGVGNTGSPITPLCRSVVAAGNCTLGNIMCTGDASSDASSCPGVDVEDNVVGYLANNSNAKYVEAGLGTVATAGRNTLALAPINDLDLTALKRFSITERFKIEFQVQALNVFNHPQYVGGFLNDVAPVGFTGSERAILEPQNADFNQPATQFSSNARTLQLALKIFF